MVESDEQERFKRLTLRWGIICVVLTVLVGLLVISLIPPPNIASQDSKERLRAVLMLTDKAQLEKIAIEDKDEYIRSQAAYRLHEKTLLYQIAAARMRYMIQESGINRRIPGITLKATQEMVSEDYFQGSDHGTMMGEYVTFVLGAGGRDLAKASWRTNFPPSAGDFEFRPADIKGEQLLTQLLFGPAFSREDLVGLSKSEFMDVRQAASGVLAMDQARLFDLVLDPTNLPAVQEGAVRRLTDQSMLADLARMKRDPAVCEAVKDRIKELAGK